MRGLRIYKHVIWSSGNFAWDHRKNNAYLLVLLINSSTWLLLRNKKKISSFNRFHTCVIISQWRSGRAPTGDTFQKIFNRFKRLCLSKKIYNLKLFYPVYIPGIGNVYAKNSGNDFLKSEKITIQLQRTHNCGWMRIYRFT